jgi:protein tyrosine phosphatase
MPVLPFERIYWVRPGLLAGCYPCSTDSGESKRMAAGLVGCGVSHFISLMEPEERDHKGNPFIPYRPFVMDAARVQEHDVMFSRHPIKDRSVPTIKEMQVILDDIDLAVAGGGTVYVHCWGGRGRTGTVVGCHLLRHRIATRETVLAQLAELTAHNVMVFRKIPETAVQENFLRHWEPGT